MRLGLFDSGVGGLTVLRAVRQEFPNADLVYLGDTARVPYGTKSPRSVARYAQQAAACLVNTNQIDAIIIACNTASALATQPLRAAFPGLSVFSVIEPGAQAAMACLARPDSSCIGVLATESTVRGGAYVRAIRELNPNVQVVGQACQILVALVEEGWTQGEIASLAVQRYLFDLRDQTGNWPQAIVLGCTHFPLLRPLVRQVADSIGAGDMQIIDSSLAIAQHLRTTLGSKLAEGQGTTQYLVTDGRERFVQVGSSFLGQSIDPSKVKIVDLV